MAPVSRVTGAGAGPISCGPTCRPPWTCSPIAVSSSARQPRRASPNPSARILTDAPGACATCAERADWAACSTYRVGGNIVGIGTDDPRVDAALQAALSAHLVDVPDAPAYYALTVADGPEAPSPRALYLLHRGPEVVLRTRAPGRALRGAVAELASYGALDGLDLVAFPALAVGGPNGVVLVPRPADPSRLARVLEPLGLRVADGGVVLVDPERREVVVGAPGVDATMFPLAALAAQLPDLGTEPAPLEWGRYPLVALAAEAGTVGDAVLAFGPVSGDPRQADVLPALVALLDEETGAQAAGSHAAGPIPLAPFPADDRARAETIVNLLGGAPATPAPASRSSTPRQRPRQRCATSRATRSGRTTCR